MSAVIQTHSQYSISRLKHRKIYSHISLGGRVMLNIYMLCSKKFLCSFYCEVLNNISIFTTTIVSFSRIPFCIFISEDRTLNFKDRRTNIVLRGYENYIFPFSFYFFLYCFKNLWIGKLKVIKIHVLFKRSSIRFIFFSLRQCLCPSKGVLIQVLTISFAKSFPTILPPRTRMLASLCNLLILAVKSSLHRDALTCGNLLATMDMPIPVRASLCN